jgi:hypothetical protein
MLDEFTTKELRREPKVAVPTAMGHPEWWLLRELDQMGHQRPERACR